ncbi:MAG: TonB-dependent receptor [Pseudomonadota bacterium]
MKSTSYAAALLIVITANSYAEEANYLDELTVTARPLGLQSTEHISQPYYILSGDELSKKQSSTVGETLSNIPGVSTNRYSPLASRPVIRGQQGTRVQVLENGISTSDVSTISVDHVTTVDPLQAEQIEILRGPATLLYGSEASGGLVNVVTNRIPQYMPEAFKGNIYSSYNTASLEKTYALQATGGYEKMALHLDGIIRDAKNYEAESGTVFNTYYDSQNLNIGTSWIDDWGFAGITYGRFDSTHGIPFNPDEPDEQPFLETEQDKISFAGQINESIGFFQAIRFQGSYNDYNHVEFEGPGEAGTVFTNEQLQARVELQHQPIGVFNGVIGTQFGYRDVSAVGEEAFLPKTASDSFAFFILEETDISDNLHFEIGARYEYQDTEPDTGSSVSHDLFSVASGIHWHLNPEIALGFNVGRSERAPAAEELFANGPHLATGTFELGATGLDKEVANNIDLSLAKESGKFQWNVSLFANYLEDFIFFDSVDNNNEGLADEVDEDGNLGGEFLLVQFQQDDAIFYGFELSSLINIFSDSASRLDLNLFGDYVRAELTNGDNLPRISPARFGAGLDYAYNKLSLGLDLTTVLEQNENAALETETDGYTLLDVNANYDFQVLSVFAKASNLLDENGRLHTSFIKDRAPIMGRSLMVGITADF